MRTYRLTIVKTIEEVFEGIEIQAASPEQAEELALNFDTAALAPSFSDVVDTHVEADLI